MIAFYIKHENQPHRSENGKPTYKLLREAYCNKPVIVVHPENADWLRRGIGHIVGLVEISVEDLFAESNPNSAVIKLNNEDFLI